MFSSVERDQIIETCLQAIHDGKTTPEACAERHPEIGDLATMLYAAQEMHSLLQIRLEHDKVQIIEKRLVQAMNRPVLRRTHVSRWSGIGSTLAASFLIVVLIGLGVGKAAAAALPGDV